MNNRDHELGELLQRTAPEPPHSIDFDAIAGRARRRRTTTAVVGGAGTVLAIAATFAVFTQLDRQPVDGPNVPIATDGGSPSPTTPDAGCPPTERHPKGLQVMVDYVPFIVLNGQEFVSQLDEVPAMTRGDLGEQVATVSCRIADLTQDSSKGVVGEFPTDYLDGNAAYLTVGTPIYAVDGFPTSCRVAVIEGGKVIPYLAHHEANNKSVAMGCATTPANAPDSQPVDASRVDVSTHCGVVSATVKGDLWLAAPPLGDHNAPEGWDENLESGTFTVTGPHTATFRTAAGLTATFTLAEPGTVDPNAGCE